MNSEQSSSETRVPENALGRSPGVIAEDVRRWRFFRLAAGAMVLAFAFPLWSLLRLAFQSDIHSHILLIPFISFYLLRTSSNARRPATFSTSMAPAVIAAVAGL